LPSLEPHYETGKSKILLRAWWRVWQIKIHDLVNIGKDTLKLGILLVIRRLTESLDNVGEWRAGLNKLLNIVLGV